MPKNWIAGPESPVGPEPKNPGAAKYPNFVKRSGPERWLRQFPSEGATPPAGGGGGTGGGGGGGTIATGTTPGIVKPGPGMTVAADGTITYTLSPATAAALGGVKQGTNIVIAPDGTISANLPGALNFKGITDVTVAPTATYDPTTAQRGDMWIASTTGTANAAWTGLTTVTKDAMVIYEGTKWDVAGSVGASVKPDWAAIAGAADEILNKPTTFAPPVLAQIHVETAGDDATGDGTAAKPFKTVEAALTYLKDSTEGQGAEGTVSKVMVGAGTFAPPDLKKFNGMTIYLEGVKTPDRTPATKALTYDPGNTMPLILAARAEVPALRGDATITLWDGDLKSGRNQYLDINKIAIATTAASATTKTPNVWAGDQTKLFIHGSVIASAGKAVLAAFDGGVLWCVAHVVSGTIDLNSDAGTIILHSAVDVDALGLHYRTNYGGEISAHVRAAPDITAQPRQIASGRAVILGSTPGGPSGTDLEKNVPHYNELTPTGYVGDGDPTHLKLAGGTWT